MTDSGSAFSLIFFLSFARSLLLRDILNINPGRSVNGGISATLTSDLWENYIGSGPKLAPVFMSEPWVYNGDKQMSVLELGTVCFWIGAALSVSACFYIWLRRWDQYSVIRTVRRDPWYGRSLVRMGEGGDEGGDQWQALSH